LMVVV